MPASTILPSFSTAWGGDISQSPLPSTGYYVNVRKTTKLSGIKTSMFGWDFSSSDYQKKAGHLHHPDTLFLIRPERSMSDLSKILQVTKPNITVLIDKLVKLDYVERVNSSNDRRVSLIRLTDAGQRLINKTDETLINSSSEILKTLDNEDRELIKQTTQAMKKLLTKFNNT